MYAYTTLNEETDHDAMVADAIPAPQCREQEAWRPQSPMIESDRLQGRPDPVLHAVAHLYQERQQQAINDDDNDDDHIGSIQYPLVVTDEEEEGQLFNKPVPLLLSWPFYYGIIEIVLGFLSVLFSVAYIFLVQDWTSDEDNPQIFNSYNSYGAMLWSGAVLILAGSLAVRICKTKSRKNIIQFYIVTFVGSMLNLSLIILTISCTLSAENTNSKTKPYVALYGISILCGYLGFIPLLITSIKYLLPVCRGRVRLGHALLVCWLPCCFPPDSETISEEKSSLI